MSSMDIDGIYKNAKLVASDTPYLKPLSDEQIVLQLRCQYCCPYFSS